MGSTAATKWLVSMLCDISMLASDTSSQTLIMLLSSGSGACLPKVQSLPHGKELTLNDTVRKFIVLRLQQYLGLSSPYFLRKDHFGEVLGTWQ